MIEHKLPNAAAHVLTITSTATSLLDLIDTAGGSAAGLPNYLNEIEIYNDGDYEVGYLSDGNTPTAANSTPIAVGEKVTIKANISKIQLIRREASDGTVYVRVGERDNLKS